MNTRFQFLNNVISYKMFFDGPYIFRIFLSLKIKYEFLPQWRFSSLFSFILLVEGISLFFKNGDWELRMRRGTDRVWGNEKEGEWGREWGSTAWRGLINMKSHSMVYGRDQILFYPLTLLYYTLDLKEYKPHPVHVPCTETHSSGTYNTSLRLLTSTLFGKLLH